MNAFPPAALCTVSPASANPQPQPLSLRCAGAAAVRPVNGPTRTRPSPEFRKPHASRSRLQSQHHANYQHLRLSPTIQHSPTSRPRGGSVGAPGLTCPPTLSPLLRGGRAAQIREGADVLL
ncbi:hypothetical protein C8J57DRAFT_1498260 [Mycena rebaudengoi]|nr:hypothetical protein C8J57DRAFT_1498260 [Mycena rebaudengoi]